MTHRTNAVGAALVVALALGALAAQGASANQEHTFEVAEAPATITAEADPDEPTHAFNFGPVAFSCEELHGTGTAAEQFLDETTLVTQYGACNAFDFPLTTTNVGDTGEDDTGACAFVFDSDTTGNPATAGKEDAPVDIECEEGKSITFDVFFDEAHSEEFCKVHIGPQQGLHGVRYLNKETEGKPTEITIETTIHDVHYAWDGPWCFLIFGSNEGASTDGTWEGKTTLRAFEHGTSNQVDASVTSP